MSLPAAPRVARSISTRSLTTARSAAIFSYRWIVLGAATLILASLLAGRIGPAIVVGLALVPLLALRYLSEIDLFEREPWFGVAATAGGGLAVGVVVGIINNVLTSQLWFDGTPLNVGAAGYGGRFAEAEGGPPALLVLASGMMMPALSMVLMMIAPMAMRRWPAFRNEVMDGVVLGASAGFGFAVATAVVYYWPLINNGANPGVALHDWTATLIGLAVVRPLLFGVAAALIGAGVWQYAMVPRSNDLVLPVTLGLGGVILFSVGDLIAAPSGTRVELLWGALVLLPLLFISFRLILRKALRHDQQMLLRGGRTVCPRCRNVTPTGAFCAVCGQPLAPEEAPVDASPEPEPEPKPSSAAAAEPERSATATDPTAPFDRVTPSEGENEAEIETGTPR